MAFSTLQLLRLEWGEQPDGIAKQRGLCIIDAAMFLASDGRTAEKTICALIAEDRAGAFRNFLFGAARICDEGVRRGDRAYSFNKINNGAHGCSQENKIAALDRLHRIFNSGVNSSHFNRPLQYGRPVATHNPAVHPGGPDCHTERSSDQAGADDGDLLKDHGWNLL